MKSFKQLSNELNERASLSTPKTTSLAPSQSTSVGKAKSPIDPSKFKSNIPGPRATVKDAASSVLRAGGRLAAKSPSYAAASGVGAVAGLGTIKALNKFGSGTDSDINTGNISKMNASRPGAGVKFKGDVPTIPSDKKYVEPQRKISQPELGGMLRGEPKKLNLPKPEIRNIGPSSSGIAAKPATITPNKPASSQPTVAKKMIPSSVSQKPTVAKKMIPSSVSQKPTVSSARDDFMADLRASAARMKTATADAAQKTGAMKSSLEKIAPSGRMERPISKGGMSSSQIRGEMNKLGGGM
jgi:hypothetical protein